MIMMIDNNYSHTSIEVETFKLDRIVIMIVIVIVMVPMQMDRNNLRDNGRLDLHQNYTEYSLPLAVHHHIPLKILKNVH